MIVVTGGAGFIGSALIWRLNQLGHRDILVVDRLGTSEKWKNLVGLQFDEFIDKQEFIDRLEAGQFPASIKAIVHLGACSATTQTDADYLIDNNYRYSVRLGTWWHAHRRSCRFLYASSAATYGDGQQGYRDDEECLDSLRPLNMYGYSKHLFDLYARSRGWLSECVGLKFFNVYGPNEQHKGDMRSVICKAWPQVAGQGVMTLFRSHHPDYRDGEQVRDFLYVKDAVEMTVYLLYKSEIGGIFNIGTGQARSWNDVAAALFAAAGKPAHINYVPMPDHLQAKYQYHTCAVLDKLRGAGYERPCTSLDAAIADYACRYLATGMYLSQTSE